MISKLNKRYLVQIASKVGGERKKRLAKKTPRSVSRHSLRPSVTKHTVQMPYCNSPWNAPFTTIP